MRRCFRIMTSAIVLAMAAGTDAFAGYAGNITVASNGTCAGISGTYPAKADVVTINSTTTQTYVTFILPPPAPATPQYLVLSFEKRSGSNFAYTASNPELFGSLTPRSGFWAGSITPGSVAVTNVTIPTLQFGTNLVLQPDSSTTGTPVQSAVTFNGGTCGLTYTGLLFQSN